MGPEPVMDYAHDHQCTQTHRSRSHNLDPSSSQKLSGKHKEYLHANKRFPHILAMTGKVAAKTNSVSEADWPLLSGLSHIMQWWDESLQDYNLNSKRRLRKILSK